MASLDDALPSSPPLGPTRPLLSRKRTHASQLSASCPSSDPAFFSSDDFMDDGAENYNSDKPRKKVQWNGTWWDETRQDSVSGRTRAATRKKAFTRNMDSGIWMGSDDSEATMPDDSALPSSNITVVVPTPTKKSQRSEVEKIVEMLIMAEIDKNPPRVDLRNLGLESLDGQLLLPLRSIVASATHFDAAGSSSPNTYAPLTPSLHLFLGNNSLSRLPAQLFDLEHTTVLSLRQNNLSELPSSIGRLRNLRELNVSCNSIRFLPSSLLPLTMGRDRTLTTFETWGNPIVNLFASPGEPPRTDKIHTKLLIDRDTDGSWMPLHESWRLHDTRLLQLIRDKLEQRQMIYKKEFGNSCQLDVFATPLVITSTPVTYFDTNGIPIIGRPIAELTDAEIVASIAEPITSTPSKHGMASLFELCLRMCTQSPDLPRLADMMPEDAADTVLAGLKSAEQYFDEGGRICSTCGGNFVIPRAEWLDFVFYRRDPADIYMRFDELLVPYINRVCSWSCANRKTDDGS